MKTKIAFFFCTLFLFSTTGSLYPQESSSANKTFSFDDSSWKADLVENPSAIDGGFESYFSRQEKHHYKLIILTANIKEYEKARKKRKEKKTDLLPPPPSTEDFIAWVKDQFSQKLGPSSDTAEITQPRKFHGFTNIRLTRYEDKSPTRIAQMNIKTTDTTLLIVVLYFENLTGEPLSLTELDNEHKKLLQSFVLYDIPEGMLAKLSPKEHEHEHHKKCKDGHECKHHKECKGGHECKHHKECKGGHECKHHKECKSGHECKHHKECKGGHKCKHHEKSEGEDDCKRHDEPDEKSGSI